MATFSPDLHRLKELYDQFGADLFALCYLQAGRPAHAADLMVSALCDIASSPRLWEMVSAGKEGLLRAGYQTCGDDSLHRPKRKKRKKSPSQEESPRAVLSFSLTDPLRAMLRLRLPLRSALFCRERMGLSPEETARVLGTSPMRAQRLADTALKKAGITAAQARTNLEAITPGEDTLEKVWAEFLTQQSGAGFVLRQRYHRTRRVMDTLIPFLALGVVAIAVAAYFGVEYGWFSGAPYEPTQPIEGVVASEIYGNASQQEPAQWVGDVSVFVPEEEGFMEYIVHNTPGDLEQILRQMVLLGGAPAGTSLLYVNIDDHGTESQEGSTVTYTHGDTLTLTVEFSEQASSLSGEEGLRMLQAMVATFEAYCHPDELFFRCSGEELTVEGHTAQDFLGQELPVTRTVETDYRTP